MLFRSVSRINVSHRHGKQEEQKNPRLGVVSGLINNFVLFHYVYNRCALSIMSLYFECSDCDFSGRSASSIQNPRDGVDVKKMEAHPQSPGKKTK